MSLLDPTMPKKECKIQVPRVATSSSITLQAPLWPWYIPCQANGQFFHAQCIQSMLPSITGNPLTSLSTWVRVVSSLVGDPSILVQTLPPRDACKIYVSFFMFKTYLCHLFDEILTLYVPLITNEQSIANLFVIIFTCSFGRGNH